jgi:uncharacterized 2Fe-2S/4Fe-4S cluster protein (DUF4445 family)
MMHEAQFPVTFQPSGRSVRVRRGTCLMEAAPLAGIALDFPCGGDGICRKCRIVVRQGAGRPSLADQQAFGPEDLAGGLRLACQTTVDGPMVVEVPETSVQASYHQILAHIEGTAQPVTDPIIHKQYVELAVPDREHDRPDHQRLKDVVGPAAADLAFLRQLPGRLRETGFRGTAVLADGQLLDFEPGDTRATCCAVAVDVGTTTLVAMLVDLQSGEELAIASRLNPQTSFGDDVLSRIVHAQRNQQRGLADLNDVVVAAVNAMIGELADQAGIGREQIYDVTFSGNTTMQQLLCRIDPTPLGEVPFVPATGDSISAAASELGLRIHPRGRAYVMPVIGGFVGGDTVSGILATELAQAAGPTLLVDIGTNGEIVLFADGKLWAASTAAGPAFEGARISHGMRASAGAIERVIVDGRLATQVIGNARPIGLCGSALIDLTAELLQHGVLTPEGRLHVPDELPPGILPDLRDRVVPHDGRVSFLLASEAETDTGRPIVVTQRDFRELQLATGAIRAGIGLLLKRAGLTPNDLASVLIAGGFGNFIRRTNAQRIGLLPPEIPSERIRYQGNTSLAGARLVAVSLRARQQAEALARRTEHVDLSRDPGFSWAFAEAMIFPAPTND